MYTPNPILLAQTPAGGYLLPVTAERGGLAGYVLLGQLGPPVTVEVSADGGTTWAAPAYPHTLAAGETLRLARADASAPLSTIRGLTPVDEGGTPGTGGGQTPGQHVVTLPLTGPLPDWQDAGGVPYRVQVLSWVQKQYAAYYPAVLGDDQGQAYTFRAAAKAGQLQAGEFTLFPRSAPQLVIYRPHADDASASRSVGLTFHPPQVINTSGMGESAANAPVLEYLVWPTGTMTAGSGQAPPDLLMNVEGDVRELDTALYVPGEGEATVSMPIMAGLGAYSLRVDAASIQNQAVVVVALPSGYKVGISAAGCDVFGPLGDILSTANQHRPNRAITVGMDASGTVTVTPYQRGESAYDAWETGQVYTLPQGAGVPGAVGLTLRGGAKVRAFDVRPGAGQAYPYGLTPPSPGGGSGAAPFTATADSEGYQTISNADATTDPGGYQTITNATATADPDGYESVERTS